jgi:hypothetical protein
MKWLVGPMLYLLPPLLLLLPAVLLAEVIVAVLLLLRTLQSMMNLGLSYDCLQSLEASQQLKVLRGGAVNPTPNPNLEGIPFCLDHDL